ncbi:MAG: hypothetical protein ACLR08_08590 [Dorea longicatena]
MDKNFGSMPLGKKVEYLWMYYKIWLVILAVVIGVIYLGCTMYKGRHTTVLLNVAVTGADSQKAEEVNKDFCKYAGIDERTGSSGYRRIFRKMEGACPQKDSADNAGRRRCSGCTDL